MSRDLARCREDEALDEALDEAFDLWEEPAPAPGLPSKQESGGLVDNVLIVDDATPSQIAADLDAWFDLVEGDGEHDADKPDGSSRPSPEPGSEPDELPASALSPARPGVYSRVVRDVGARDSVVDVLLEYLGEGEGAPRDRAAPEPPPEVDSSQLYRRVPSADGRGWDVVLVSPGKVLKKAGRRRAPSEHPSSPPDDLDDALAGVVVGGDCIDADSYRSPVPEIRITSVDLDALEQVASPESIEHLETAMGVLRSMADDCFGLGRHKTVLRAAAVSEALSVARPRADPWVLSSLVLDEAGDLGGFIDLGMHPSLRRLRAGVGRQSLVPLLEQTAMFIVRCAQNVYLESFLGQSPVTLVADVAALARFFWSMLPLELVLGEGRCGDDPLVFNIAFSFDLIKNGEGTSPRAVAISFDVGDGARATDRKELLPREAFHHAVICRSRDDHSFMDCELYPRTDLEIAADGTVIGPDGSRYPIDLPGVMSHLKI